LGAEPVAAGATPPTPASSSPCSAPRNNSHNWSKRSSTPRACRRGWAQLIATLQSLTADFDPTNPQQRKSACLAVKAFTTVVRFLAPPAQAAEWTVDADRIRAVLAC
jgi:hypothetical protein